MGRTANTNKTSTTKQNTTQAKTTVVEKENKNMETDMAQMLADMQAQMAQMQAELAEAKKEKDEAVGQNLDLQTLVDALKANSGKGGVDGNLPNYVTVVSLVPNVYNFSTEADGRGTAYSFEELGESKVISLRNLQEIMGISKYRKQAEEGYFYILDNDVNDYFRLDSVTNDIDDIRSILSLSAEDSVDKFVNLAPKLQEAIADRMAKDIANGERVDKNKIADIYDKTGIDIETKARQLKKILKK